MKNHKNIILSLGSYLLAFLWFFLWSQFIYGNTSNPADAFSFLYVSPYYILLAIGIFFGWKNVQSKKSLVLVSNVITLIGVLVLLASIAYYSWLTAWI